LAAAFLGLNRGAFSGYFSADDLDNLGWTRTTAIDIFLRGLISPKYFTNHFRPVGHFLYRVLGALAELQFPWYIATIQVLHIGNAALTWKILRRLELPGTAAIIFLFHAAAIPAVWQPMYLFDICCTLFCLVSVVMWLDARWILSFIAFWLAYKSKEQAVMLPFVLLFLDTKNWKKLVPFFAVSAMFGVQGLAKNAEGASTYALAFDRHTLVRTASFYASALWLLPFGLIRSKKHFWIGTAASIFMLAPVLALPNRMDIAYLYSSLPWLAVAIAPVFAIVRWQYVAVFCAVWIPLNHREITAPADNRAYVEVLKAAQGKRFVYDGFPPTMQPWGIQGVLRFLIHDGPIELTSMDTGTPADATILGWNFATRKLHVSLPTKPAAYLNMVHPMPLWQLENGWYPVDDGFRWSKPHAEAKLLRPENAAYFEMNINASETYLQAVKAATIRVRIDGVHIGSIEIKELYWQRHRLPIPQSSPKLVQIQLDVEPAFQSDRDGRILGAPLGGFGFVEGTK